MKFALTLALILCIIWEVYPRRSNRVQDHYKMGEKKPGDLLIFSKKVDRDESDEHLTAHMEYPGELSKSHFRINYLEILDYNHFKSYTESLHGGAGDTFFELTQISEPGRYMDIEVNVWGSHEGTCVIKRTQKQYEETLRSIK